jgi:hypothetical protein
VLSLLLLVLSGRQVAHNELSAREVGERFDQFHEMLNITQTLKLRCFLCRERIASAARGASSGLVLEFRLTDEMSAIIPGRVACVVDAAIPMCAGPACHLRGDAENPAR